MGIGAAIGAGVSAIGGALSSIPIGAAVTGAAGLASAAISGSAANSAASKQVAAEQQAASIQQQELEQTRADLSPYNQAGQQATTDIQNLGAFNFAPTQAQLESTPGYQFNLSQGLKATQNGYAAQGLGTSGAALKGAATYASGLADTTYQNQFANALNSYNTNLGRFQNLAATGENAAAQTGTFNTQTGGNIGQTAVGAANASAAATVGTANAASSAIGGLGSAYLYSNLFNQNNASIYGNTGNSPSYNFNSNNNPVSDYSNA